MTSRRPLVLLNGAPAELPVGDEILGAPEDGGGGYVPTANFRNLLHNGNFLFWDYASSLAAPSLSSSGFLATRWRCYGFGNTTFTATRQNFAEGQTDVPHARHYHRCVVTGGNQSVSGFLLKQAIEGVRTYAGKTVFLSFYARADANKPIAVDFSQQMGTGGTPSANVNAIGAQQFALTTAWQRFTASIALPSLAGKTLGTNEDDRLELVFWFDAGSVFADRAAGLGNQSGTFDLADVQLEPGEVTEFEMRPIVVERCICDRFCQRYGANNELLGTGLCIGSSEADIWFPYRAPMRVAPSLMAMYGTGYVLRVSSYEYTPTSLIYSADQRTATGVRVRVGRSGLTTGQAALLGLSATASPSSFVILSADWD
ncbi:MAG: hypothetical protein BWY57_01616 [Betaproteobacteria bacterium ADurb.Bin341]|nr:MAG: hypothetical protein BWY57_01616 [Betaproteobacteria bacterium ADurb.Bin341]